MLRERICGSCILGPMDGVLREGGGVACVFCIFGFLRCLFASPFFFSFLRALRLRRQLSQPVKEVYFLSH